jgi:hypothetical protein
MTTRLGADRLTRAAELRAGVCEKFLRQVEDVVSLPQRRHDDREFVQAVVDILAEPARPYLALSQPAFGQLQDEVPGMPDEACAGLE